MSDTKPAPPPETLTPTPLTDAFGADSTGIPWTGDGNDLVSKALGKWAAFARTLERELASLRRQLEEAKAEHDRAGSEMELEIHCLKAQLAERTRERDQWHTVAEGLAKAIRGHKVGIYALESLSSAFRHALAEFDAAKHG